VNPKFWRRGVCLRNRLLHWTSESIPARLATFLPCAIGLFAFVSTLLKRPEFRLLAPIALASIAVMPLIEQRYYLVPLVSFMAFRKAVPAWAEWLNLAFYVAVSAVLTGRIARAEFFL